jgi:hypothetical protein
MDTLENLSYVKVMLLIINASRNKRDLLLHILPDCMADNIDIALKRQSDDKMSFQKQKYHKGLKNHCLRKIIQLFDAKDDEDVDLFLARLTDRMPHLSELLKSNHNFFKWRSDLCYSLIYPDLYHG